MKPVTLLILMAIGILATAAGGWYSAELPDELIGQQPLPKRVATSLKPLENQGAKLRTAISAIRDLGLAAEPVVAAPAAASETPLAKPEVEQLLAVALKAIIRDGDGYAVLLTDSTSGENQKRRSGQAFRDGWRFYSVTPSEITLRKGGDTRAVPVMLRNDSLPQPETEAPAP